MIFYVKKDWIEIANLWYVFREDIKEWLDDNKIDWTSTTKEISTSEWKETYIEVFKTNLKGPNILIIEIEDINKALLFKLTWG